MTYSRVGVGPAARLSGQKAELGRPDVSREPLETGANRPHLELVSRPYEFLIVAVVAIMMHVHVAVAWKREVTAYKKATGSQQSKAHKWVKMPTKVCCLRALWTKSMSVRVCKDNTEDNIGQHLNAMEWASASDSEIRHLEVHLHIDCGRSQPSRSDPQTKSSVVDRDGRDANKP